MMSWDGGLETKYFSLLSTCTGYAVGGAFVVGEGGPAPKNNPPASTATDIATPVAIKRIRPSCVRVLGVTYIPGTVQLRPDDGQIQLPSVVVPHLLMRSVIQTDGVLGTACVYSRQFDVVERSARLT